MKIIPQPKSMGLPGTGIIPQPRVHDEPAAPPAAARTTRAQSSPVERHAVSIMLATDAERHRQPHRRTRYRAGRAPARWGVARGRRGGARTDDPLGVALRAILSVGRIGVVVQARGKVMRRLVLVAALTLLGGLLGAAGTAQYASATSWSPTEMIDSNAGDGTVTVLYNGKPQVFSRTAEGALRYCSYSDAFGPGWGCNTIDTQESAGRIGALVWNGQLHIFYSHLVNFVPACYDVGGCKTYELRHMWKTGSGGWQTEDTIDPFASNGTANGTDVTAIVYGGNPHVFYTNSIGKWPIDTGSALRHAWWNGSQWSTETLDGHGSPGLGGRTSEWIVGDLSTLVSQSGLRLEVFYSTIAGALRHAWYNWGRGWGFESLDGGNSSARVVGRGQIDGDLTTGGGISAVLYGNNPHVFFNGNGSNSGTSPTNGTGDGVLRHCYWGSAAWNCETLDLSPKPWYAYWAPIGRPSAVAWNGTLQVFYGAFNDLNHKWWSNNAWQTEKPWDAGSVGSSVGDWTAATTWNGSLHAYYQGHHDLDHRWFDAPTPPPPPPPPPAPAVSLANVVRRSDGSMDLFMRDAAQTPLHEWVDTSGRVLHAWETIGGSGHVLGAPAATWNASGTQLDMYAVGTDHAIWHNVYAGGWGVWTPMRDGGIAGDGNVTVTRRPDGSMDLFKRASDGQTPEHEWVSGSSAVLHAWEVIGNSGHVLGAPSGTWNASGTQLDMYGVGTDHAIWHNVYAGGWGVWTAIGTGGITGDGMVTSTRRSDGSMDLFIRASDGKTPEHEWTDSNSVVLHSWEVIPGGQVLGPPAASWSAGGVMDMFAVGFDHAIWHDIYAGGWANWTSVGGQAG